MSGFDKKRLVLIHSIVTSDGSEKHIFGTGYFVTRELVLTARHVLSGPPEKIEVRLETSQEKGKNWVRAELKPAWENGKLDAALIKVTQPIDDVPFPDWGDVDFEHDVDWESVAYPEASYQKTENSFEVKTSGLRGTLYAHGGGGQGTRELDLGVEHEPTLWAGISGAPVFVGDKLIGVIKLSLLSYEQRRLSAVPVDLLLRDPGFRTAIAPTWLRPFPQRMWSLVLVAENGNSDLAAIVRGAIRSSSKDIERVTSQEIDDEPIVVNVTEALESPERLFQFVSAVCAAPIMVFDVTDFQPAIMLFLGIRSIARRGVTITTTTEAHHESFLSELPFNIQETKLIHLSDQYEINSPRYKLNWISSAIVNGLMQVKSHPNYLDLPAYDAVRCPEPKNLAGVPSMRDKILMLCSFNKAYEGHWRYISDKIAISAAPRPLERMIDISAPRLVGLALYESIRWTPFCIVDWTHWRPNVFFELGVRYACSDIGPICLIEEEASGETAPSSDSQMEPSPKAFSLSQRTRLIELLSPLSYKLHGPSDPFRAVIERYNAIINGQEAPLIGSSIAHDAIYRTIVSNYHWAQESITRLPHDEIRTYVQAQLGKDPQKEGESQILFSSNPEFAREVRRNVQERWIAAWYYLRSRHPISEFDSNPRLRNELITLGEEVAQSLSKSHDPDHVRIRQEVIDAIDAFGES
jgi:Trypsin-like peptidase domain